MLYLGQVSIYHPDVLISVNDIPELKEITLTDDGLVIGAAVTLSELEGHLLKVINQELSGRDRHTEQYCC